MINYHTLRTFYLIGITSIVCNYSLLCQSPWIKEIALGRFDSPRGLIHGDSSTFYITHRYSEGGSSPVTQQLTKVSITGNEIWNLQFQNPPYHVFEGPISLLPGNDVIACYLFEDSLSLDYKIFRITSEGNIKWSKSLPTLVHLEIDYAFEIYKVISISANDIRLYFRMNYYWNFDPPSAKNGYISLDSLGQEKSREYFNTNGEYQWPYNIVQTNDSQFVKVYRPTLGAIDLMLRYELLDRNYNLIWNFEIGPEANGSGGPVCTDSNSNVYFTWNHDTTGNGGPFYNLPSIVSLNREGEFRWLKNFGEDIGVPVFYDIISTKDGRIIACGQEGNSTLSGGNYRTGWIVCIDTDGNKLWERRYVLEETSKAGNNFYYLIEADDGGLILFGILYREGSSDAYVMKTNYFGCLNEGCELYNFISLKTSTEHVFENNKQFYTYINNSTLNLVSLESPSFENMSYDIVSLTGNVIEYGQVNDNITEIDITHVVPGIYFIRVYHDSGRNISLIKFFRP